MEFNETESLQFRKSSKQVASRRTKTRLMPKAMGTALKKLRQIRRSRTRWQSHTVRRARRMACSASAKPRGAWRTNGETDAGAGLDGISDNGEPEYSDEDK